MKKTKIKKDLSNKLKEIGSGNKVRGITLISLVITIIVLLILAGISIAQLTGNGLFEKAKLAKEEYTNAQRKEETEIENLFNTVKNINQSSRDNKLGFNESTIITNIDFECLEINGEYVKLRINSNNNEEVIAYGVMLNNKLFKISENNEFIVYNLSLNTDYNAIVYALDKDNNVRFSNVKSFKTLEHQYLLKDGVDFEVLTGGWKKAIYAGSATVTKNTGSITFSQPYANGNGSSFVTTKKVSVNKYNNLHIEYTLTTDWNKIFGISSIQTYNGSTWGFQKELELSNSGQKTTSDLNITDIDGDYYIQSYFNDGVSFVVYNVYFE